MSDYKDIVGTAVRNNAGTLTSAKSGELFYASTALDFIYRHPNVTAAGAWRTGNDMNTARMNPSGAGPQTAGLVIGGPTYPYKKTLEYNGTSWSEETELPISMAAHGTGGTVGKAFSATTAATYLWTGGFVTGSADTYNNFSQNPTGRYLLTNKLQANYSPGTSGGVTSGSSDGYGGGY